MRSSLFALVLALLIPLCAIADDQPSRIRVSDLEKTPIATGALKIRITKFRGSFMKLGSGSKADDKACWKDFHDAFLAYGGPPIPLVRGAMMGEAPKSVF